MENPYLFSASLFAILLLASWYVVLPSPAKGPDEIYLSSIASRNCMDSGYRLEAREGPSGAYNVCVFRDGSECEEWDFYRNECYPGMLRRVECSTDSDCRQPLAFETKAICATGKCKLVERIRAS